MVTTVLKTLFIPMQDYAADIEHETNRWFDRDHVPERLSCAGFLGCERFQLTDIEPPGWNSRMRWFKYLNVYTVEGPEVLSSEAYRHQTEQPPGPWMARWLAADRAADMGELYARRSTARRWSIRSLWCQRASTWRPNPVRMPPPRAVYVVLRDVDPAHDEAFNQYMDEEAVPELLSCPGFLGCERYQAAAQAPMPMPGEPAAMPHPGYMDVFDIETPEVLTNPVFWKLCASPSPRARTLEPHCQVRGMGVYLQRPSPWLVQLS
ncbi:MAG: hypothetical protein KDK91_33520 [Gammaproteobacteria bacterium]|nr:hypothetical protein [Gammaproteobacteria bacterium]